MFVFQTNALSGPRFVINFPTKRHWRAQSRLPDISAGLQDLRQVIRDHKIRSIAIPPLGCGNGGLNWDDVRPLIVQALGDLPDVEVMIYSPTSAPPPQSMLVGTERPGLTSARAALLAALASYIRLSNSEQLSASNGASLLEMQKLMYFMQVAGQPLRLNYSKGRYGPHAENLNHALQTLEGHYIRGYGDRSQLVTNLSPIALMSGAEDEAQLWLRGRADQTSARIVAVLDLVKGFASAYGLELLATVHWMLTHEATGNRHDAVSLTKHVGSWNERKGRLFTEVHVRRAMDHLENFEWARSPTP